MGLDMSKSSQQDVFVHRCNLNVAGLFNFYDLSQYLKDRIQARI